jgi:hypothetical protein
MDVLNADGISAAQQRWKVLKQKMRQHPLNETMIRNRGNRLFFQYGVAFLLFDRTLRRLGLKK